MNYLLFPTLLLAFLLFGVGSLLGHRRGKGLFYILMLGLATLAALPGIAFTVYYFKLFPEYAWFYEFRSWPFTELTASGAGLIAGLLHARYSPKPQFLRIAGRWFFPGLLLLGLLVPYLKPLVLAPRWSQFQDRWADSVCLQSSESSCGPACAATLLAHFGKTATELELAKECHTCRTSTEAWFLARALRKRGMNVRFQIDKDLSKPWPFPAIAGVRLPQLGNAGHFITVLGRTNDSYIIGDPLDGKVLLRPSDASKDYLFTGFFIVVE
jgi:hypothetical protein